MHHVILIAALAEDRRRRSPCGAVTQQPYCPCRECQTVAAWPRKTAWASRRALHKTYARTAKARLLARVASLLQAITKGVES